jgi:hypothetical protein
MPGFDNSVVYFEKGIDPRGVSPVANQMTTGTLLIGSSVSPYVICTTLTQGAGISVTNGDGSITIANTGGGFTWTDATLSSYTLAAQNGYICDRGGGVAFTLPATASYGDTIEIVGKNGLWSIAQNANQYIGFGAINSTVGVGGSITATNLGDCVKLVCIVPGASTGWRIVSSVGNLTVV